MGKLKKALKKFSKAERIIIKSIIILLKDGSFENLDIKKLKGRADIFRVRKGKIRIIYQTDEENKIHILVIERRTDVTYKKL